MTKVYFVLYLDFTVLSFFTFQHKCQVVQVIRISEGEYAYLFIYLFIYMDIEA